MSIQAVESHIEEAIVLLGKARSLKVCTICDVDLSKVQEVLKKEKELLGMADNFMALKMGSPTEALKEIDRNLNSELSQGQRRLNAAMGNEEKETLGKLLKELRPRNIIRDMTDGERLLPGDGILGRFRERRDRPASEGAKPSPSNSSSSRKSLLDDRPQPLKKMMDRWRDRRK